MGPFRVRLGVRGQCILDPAQISRWSKLGCGATDRVQLYLFATETKIRPDGESTRTCFRGTSDRSGIQEFPNALHCIPTVGPLASVSQNLFTQPQLHISGPRAKRCVHCAFVGSLGRCLAKTVDLFPASRKVLAGLRDVALSDP